MKYLKFKMLLLAFVGSMLISASAAAQSVIIYGDGHEIDIAAAAAGGVVLAAGNPVEGFSAAELAAAIGDGFSGAYGPYDALVIGENLSVGAAEATMILDFTAAGGRTVVLGRHSTTDDILNDIFGYSVTQFAADSSDHTPINKVAAGPGPDVLLTLNGSWFLDSAPGILLYTREGGGDAAFIDDIGLGTLAWLAWDFCECSELDADQADWYSVLGTTAIGAAAPPDASAIPVPTTSTYGLIALIFSVLFGALYFNRRRWT